MPPPSSLQNLRHVLRDGLFKLARLGVEGFEFFVQRFELFLEILVTHFLAGGDTDVTTRVEAPALGFDLLECGDFAEAEDVTVSQLLAEHFRELRLRVVSAKREIRLFTAV